MFHLTRRDLTEFRIVRIVLALSTAVGVILWSTGTRSSAVAEQVTSGWLNVLLLLLLFATVVCASREELLVTTTAAYYNKVLLIFCNRAAQNIKVRLTKITLYIF